MKEIAGFAQAVVDRASALNGHSAEDWRTLASVRTVTTAWAPELAAIFGEVVYGAPALADLMSRHSRGDRESAIAIWFERVASGAPGDTFWGETALIGMYHAAASVSNEHLLAFMSRMEARIAERCLTELEPARGIAVLGAFQRVLGVARAVMVEAYEGAIIEGVVQLGFNPRLMTRLRGVAVRKMIDDSRSTMPLMVWDDALSVGVAEVDRQHKVLIELLNLLHSSSTAGKGNETLRKVLADLAGYTVDHFAFEEKMLAEHGYPELPEHKDSHEKLKGRVVEFKESFDAGRSELGVELFMFLRSWLNGHIRGSDRHYGRYLNSVGVH